MIISQITVNELREIDSMKINLDDKLINYLSNEEGVSLNGTPSSFILRNIGVSVLKLSIAIWLFVYRWLYKKIGKTEYIRQI